MPATPLTRVKRTSSPANESRTVNQQAGFDALVPSTGFLSDRRIRDALDAGYLLERGTWDTTAMRPACYALRLGERVHVRGPGAAEFAVTSIDDARPILRLEPGATALLYSLERLRLPNNILGFTVARGLLFSQPLVPENTYVDPGFFGEIYIVVTNITGRAVDLMYKMTIARLFFYRLEEAAEQPYQRAVAAGIPQHLDEHDVIDPATPAGATQAAFSALVDATAQVPIPGSFIHAELFTRLRRRLDYFTLALVVWPLLLVFAYGSHRLRNALGGKFVTGVVGAIIAGFVIWAGPRLWDRFRRQ
jgi:dCTP deaminase